MKSETPADYRRVKAAALQQLAAAGDRAAIGELERRGIACDAVNVTRLDYLELRRLVLAWREGATLDERTRNRELAERAQQELEIRHAVDTRMYAADGHGRAPQPPPSPPWRASRPPRCIGWERPGGSKLYPDPATVPANAETRESWRRAHERAKQPER